MVLTAMRLVSSCSVCTLGWANKQPGHWVYWCSGRRAEWVSRRWV